MNELFVWFAVVGLPSLLVPTSGHPGVWGYYKATAIAALPEIEKAYVDLLFALAE